MPFTPLIQASSSPTMKSMIKDEPKKGYKYTDLPVPEPVKDEVLIKVDKVAICGSDINLFVWNEMAQVKENWMVKDLLP